MNNLKNYGEKINNCSRCGLCQAVCPVYDITKNDCDAPRGKLIMLKNLLLNNEKPSKKMKKYINRCLDCKKCVDYCPSDIDMSEIKSSFNEEYLKFGVLNSNSFCEFILKTLFLYIKLYKFLKIDAITEKFGLNKFFNSLIKVECQYSAKEIANPKMKVLYFQSCMSKYINPSQKNAIQKLLNENNIKIEIGNFKCCGHFQYSKGNIKEYKKLEKHNSKIINETKYDYVIFDCDTCLSQILKYEKVDKNKCIHIDEFLLKLEKFYPKDNKIAYHKPCLKKEMPKILNYLNCDEINNSNTCCGASIPFLFENKKLSDLIAQKNAKNYEKFEFILTSCNLCKIGLIKGFILNKIDKKVLSVPEYLAKE